MKKYITRERVFFALFAAASAVLLILQNAYYLQIGIMCCLYSMMTIALNLITGFTGQLLLGQVGFYAVGAYVSAILSMRCGLPVLLTMLIAAVVTALVAALLGAPILRLSGMYLGIATLGLAEIIRQIALAWRDMTRGPLGINRIPHPNLFGLEIRGNTLYFLFALALLAIVYVLVRRLVHSRVGLYLLATRKDETAAECMGVNVRFYKVLAFAIAAGISGFCGAFFAHFFTYIAPTNFTSAESYLVLSMYALGGPGSLIGSICGATLLSIASEALRFIQSYRQIIYGLLLIFIVLFQPAGLAGLLRVNDLDVALPRDREELRLNADKH